jgi:histidinol phosphatase-like enzyme
MTEENQYKKIIYIDIDETICRTPDSRDYTLSEPILENIKKANLLYDQGNKIVYWTARGTVTGIDWESTTKEQFNRWGVRYHDLKLGKPYYDLFIDDKNMNTEHWK